jgi:hypothetical protein
MLSLGEREIRARDLGESVMQELKLMEKRLADLTQKAEELRKELKEKE